MIQAGVEMRFLTSLSEMSAADGMPVVLLGALQAFGALALIIGVLLIMDKVYKKNHPDADNNIDSSEQEEKDTGDNE